MNSLRNLLESQSRCWNVFKRKQLKLQDCNYLQLPPEIIPFYCRLFVLLRRICRDEISREISWEHVAQSSKDRNNRKRLSTVQQWRRSISNNQLKPDRSNPVSKIENLILCTTKAKKKELEVSANITFHKDASKHKRDLCSVTDNYLRPSLRVISSSSSLSSPSVPFRAIKSRLSRK